MQVLVPNHEMRRPKIEGQPFSSELLFHRSSAGWCEVMNDTPYYLYQIHTSRTYLVAPLLEANMYMIMLKFMARDYEAACKLTDSMTVDVDFTPTEQWVFDLLRHCKDKHPDAHARRLKLLLALQYSENVAPFWAIEQEMEG